MTTEIYKDYIIESAIDDSLRATWKCKITDSRLRFFTEVKGCNSRESAFTVARQIIDAEERSPGNTDYQDPKEYPDFTG
ncbi:hypothetical protein [Fischerella sp. PCC 9605]|uniref:hypothetical protein n=1 Tax=Fischerella sp. PCC 9605 TaxID=1173024 RepID=UPI00047E8DCF|nr:hypothetical protein [Fischerella sp. PCC 9605]